MSHNDFVRPMGVWATLSVLEHFELEQFDLAQFQSINGDLGGTWNPASQIILGGSGLKVAAPFWSTGNFRVDTNADLRGGATVTGGNLAASLNITAQGTIHADGTIDSNANINATGNMTAGGSAQFGGGLDVTGNGNVDGTLHAGGATTLGSTLAVTGNAGFSAALGVTGNLNAAADVNVGGALSVADLATFQERVDFGGGITTRSVIGPNSNNTYTVATVDEVIVEQTTLSADRVYTLVSTGAVAGSRIRFTSLNATWNVTVAWPGGTQIITHQVGEVMTLELVFIGGTWHQALYVRRTT